MKQLTFAWWNLNNFAHFDKVRAGERRWPDSAEAFHARLARLSGLLKQHVFLAGTPVDLLGVAECTADAARAIRDHALPNHHVLSLDLQISRRSDLHVAFIYNPDFDFQRRPPLAVPYMPRGTRAMAVLDCIHEQHCFRFFGCHWAARFQTGSEFRRQDVASHLAREVYDFLKDGAVEHIRHVVILGDLNDEPYGVVDTHLRAVRSRTRAKEVIHYAERDIAKQRIYNLAWRMLGERVPHDGNSQESGPHTAGTYYWTKRRSWHTYDQVIVDGSLLTDDFPYIDESSLTIIAHEALLDSNGFPAPFVMAGDGNALGMSDHLPITGNLVLGESPDERLS